MVFVYTAMGVLCVEHANVLELCYIELLSGDGSPYSILSVFGELQIWLPQITPAPRKKAMETSAVNRKVTVQGSHQSGFVGRFYFWEVYL